MYSFRCVFSVNGVRTEQIISARTAFDARKLVEASFPGARIVWWSCAPVRN